MSNFEKVREFHQVFGVETNQEFSSELVKLRVDLIDEEFTEVWDEFYETVSGKHGNYPEYTGNIDKVKLTKELADLLYVVYGTGVTFGLPLDDAFDLVHKSNMSKLTVDGKVLRREDGKVLKSDQYKPADLSELFKEN